MQKDFAHNKYWI